MDDQDEIAVRMEARMKRARVRALAMLETAASTDAPLEDAVELFAHCLCVFAIDEMILITKEERRASRKTNR